MIMKVIIEVIIKEICLMKVIKFEIPDNLHRDIKLYCISQKVSMYSFLPELIEKGWQVVETMNNITTDKKSAK